MEDISGIRTCRSKGLGGMGVGRTVLLGPRLGGAEAWRERES